MYVSIESLKHWLCATFKKDLMFYSIKIYFELTESFFLLLLAH